jgi:UDP-N-acetylmuramoylalanine--D-glutamate ligase
MSDSLTEQTPIGVLGLGLSGIAAVHFLVSRGYPVLAWDQNPDKGAELASLPQVTRLTDLQGAFLLGQCQSLLLSPGIPRTHPVLIPALAMDTPVINDVEWLFQHCQDQNSPAQFIGITGTNGKSTVTTLVGQMLEHSPYKTKTGGNLGQAALSLWQEETEKYVLELSSFQLESLPRFHPQTAALLNLSPDHLDRYEGMSGYLAAKLNIFAQQGAGDFAVLNGDDPALMAAYHKQADPQVTVIPFSTQKAIPGGLYIEEGQLVDHRGERGEAFLACDRLEMTGIHNQANALADAAIALCAGCSKTAVVETLTCFPGLPHRMEWIRTLDDVSYYNDSKGTNVGAVLQSLASFSNRLVLIAGGRDKNSDFSPLVAAIKKHVSHAILMGEAAETLEKLFVDHTQVERAGSMKEAVEQARKRAKPGEVVLLSPGCSSFDMFNNFEDRGDIFRKAVHEL